MSIWSAVLLEPGAGGGVDKAAGLTVMLNTGCPEAEVVVAAAWIWNLGAGPALILIFAAAAPPAASGFIVKAEAWLAACWAARVFFPGPRLPTPPLPPLGPDEPFRGFSL